MIFFVFAVFISYEIFLPLKFFDPEETLNSLSSVNVF